MNNSFKVIVEGDYALFTRQEMKVERVSYDVPTPSALEGMLKSVYWKPPIKIVIDTIIVFNPIKFINIRRNEVKSKVKLSSIKKQMKNEGSPEIFTSEERSQRAGMILKDVKYGIEFHIESTGLKDDHKDECIEKHLSIMKRRLEKGQCFRQPCFGCREFSVKSIKLIDEFDLCQISDELNGDIDLGYMLYGLKFKDGGKPINNDWDNPIFSDNANAMYYRPHMINGVIDVKKYRRDILC